MLLLDLPDIAVVDVETTGGSPSAHRIIEIGIIRISGGRIARRYQSVVDPGCPIPPFIQRLTGITTAETDAAPAFGDIAEEVTGLLKDAIFMAHNVRFDYGFVRQELARLGRSYSARTLCSARLSRALYPQHRHHDLGSLIERFDLRVHRRHRALDDVEAVVAFIDKAVSELGDAAVRQAAERLLGNRAAQTGLPASVFDDLPEAPGVYVLRDAEGRALYVGKSLDIRQRVLSHLYADHTSKRELEMTQRIAGIEHHRTPGELSALLLESEMVKRLDPVYNRRLRKVLGPLCALRSADARGYPTVILERYRADIRDDDVIAFHHSVHQARSALRRAADDHGLCPRLLGLETGKGACFASHLGKCRGACTGREPAEVYQRRFASAFPEEGPLYWPYRSVLALEESAGDSGEVLLVDRWRIIGRIRYEEGCRRVEHLPGQLDPDTLTILRRALSDRNAGLRVRKISAGDVDRLETEA